MRVGERIKAAIKERGCTHYQIAERAGISESYLSQIISGKKNPKIELRRRLASALDVHPEYLDTIREAPPGVPVIAIISAQDGFHATANRFAEVGITEGGFIDSPPGVSQRTVTDRQFYALRIRGDSMIPRLHDGDYLYMCTATADDLKTGSLVVLRDAEGLGRLKEIEIVNHDTIVFRSVVGEGSSIIKQRSEIKEIERAYALLYA